MKPKPFASLNHLTVPEMRAIRTLPRPVSEPNGDADPARTSNQRRCSFLRLVRAPQYKQMVPNVHSPVLQQVGRGRADEPWKTRSRSGRLPDRLLVCVSSIVA